MSEPYDQPADRPELVLRLAGVELRKGDRTILTGIDWEVRSDESWVVLGLNGSGKSSLVRVASMYEHPSSGTVDLLGERLGRTDVRTLRAKVGLAAASLADRLRPDLSARDVVMTARYGALEPWWHAYSTQDRVRAEALLERMGCGGFGDRAFGTLSSGERQRVLLARTLMVDPGLLLLDEPTAGLDLAGREELVATLDELAVDARSSHSPPVVLVTHHVEEAPASFTHALLLHEGRVLDSGSIGDVLVEEKLSRCFGLPLVLEHRGGRWSARART